MGWARRRKAVSCRPSSVACNVAEVDQTQPGLAAEDAARRLAADGPNALPGDQRRTLLSIVGKTVREPMFLLLLTAGTLYLAFGDLQEGVTLFGFVLVTLGLTLYQEGKTERAIEALRDLTSPRALVIRDGRPQRIAGRDVVRGDLLQLSEGDRVPADAWLVAADGLRLDESLLTGEAVPVSKLAAARDAPAPEPTDGTTARPGGDDLPSVYAGTLVVQGHGLARVTATGARSEIGRIGAALGTLAAERSPLQKQTATLVRNLALLALALSLALVLVHGLLRGDWLAAVLAGIALAMAMLPEEIPGGAHRVPRAGRPAALARGGVDAAHQRDRDVGRTDKTGTLTENRMTVSCLVAGGPVLDARMDVATLPGGELPEAFHTLVEYSILASVVDPFDPMEKAFHQLGEQFLTRTEHLHRDWRLVQTYALSPALRAMSHVWAAPAGGAQVVAAKGAPEAVIELCHLDAATQSRIAVAVDALAADGLRVLAVAKGRFEGQDWPSAEHDFDFAFVGLLGLSDPLRAQVPGAIAECRAARYPRGDDHWRLSRYRARDRPTNRPGRGRGGSALRR